MNTGRTIFHQDGRFMKKSRNYNREVLLKRLRDPSEAVAYLNAALQDDDTRVFLFALRDIVDANGGGISIFAKETHNSIEKLYIKRFL